MGTPDFHKLYESPPAAIVNRVATVQPGVLNTIRFPGDVYEDQEARWHQPGSTTSAGPRARMDVHPITRGNQVRFFVDGEESINAMADAIAATDGKFDFIYMLNWFADPSVYIGNRNQRLAELLGEAADRNVQIRAMYWRQFQVDVTNPLVFLPLAALVAGPFLGLPAVGAAELLVTALPPWNIAHAASALTLSDGQNGDMVKFINEGEVTVSDPRGNPFPDYKAIHLNPSTGQAGPVGCAIHDQRINRTNLDFGLGLLNISCASHHQKILCVKAKGELIAFCGGVDFNPDRILTLGSGSPLHDAHIEVRGPGATSLLQTFVDRWEDHPESNALDQKSGKLVVATTDLDPASVTGTGRATVQIGRTFGCRTLYDGPDHYKFAPDGEQTGRQLLLNAISKAKKFIYLEDQYFVNEEAGKALEDVLKANDLAHITIVVPHHSICDMPFGAHYRRKVIKSLKQVGPGRVREFYLMGPNQTQPGEWHSYVHTKVTIIDDDFAAVGSMNYNERGWRHDSEVLAGVSDPSSDQVLTSRFAHWLRTKIWAEHLFDVRAEDHDADAYAELWDGVAAGALWERLILIKRRWWERTYGGSQGMVPPWERSGGKIAPPHPRDYGYDQAAEHSEPLAQTARVRPYDEDDEPQMGPHSYEENEDIDIQVPQSLWSTSGCDYVFSNIVNPGD